jgi:Transcriptional regulator PadR-like family
MDTFQTNLLQGTLDLLILKTLSLGEMHGLGISRRIEQSTNGTFQVKPGSHFPALHRLEQAGWRLRRPCGPLKSFRHAATTKTRRVKADAFS